METHIYQNLWAEQPILFIAIVLVISILSAIGIFILSSALLGRKVKFSSLILYSFIFSSIHLPMNILFNTYLEFNTLLWTLGVLSLQSAVLSLFLYRISRQRIAMIVSDVALAHFILETFYNLFEGAIWAFLVWAKGQNYDVGNRIFYLILLHVGFLLFGILVSLIVKRLHFQKYFAYLFKNRHTSTLTMCICLVLMHAYVLIKAIFTPEQTSMGFAIGSLIMIFIVLFALQFVAMFVAGREQIRIQEETILQQQAYVHLLEELQREVRTFRHDFQNLLSSVALQANNGDLEGIHTFTHNITGYFDQKLGNEIRHMGNLAQIAIYPLRSLLTVKVAQMRQRDIAAEVEILLPITQLGMQREDFLRCVGILMDNAVEAATRCKGGIVRILLLQTKQELLFVVSNTCTQKPDMQAMQIVNYTTKGKGHGIGLESYRRILAGYENCVTRTVWNAGFFTQELRILLQP